MMIFKKHNLYSHKQKKKKKKKKSQTKTKPQISAGQQETKAIFLFLSSTELSYSDTADILYLLRSCLQDTETTLFSQQKVTYWRNHTALQNWQRNGRIKRKPERFLPLNETEQRPGLPSHQKYSQYGKHKWNYGFQDPGYQTNKDRDS